MIDVASHNYWSSIQITLRHTLNLSTTWCHNNLPSSRICQFRELLRFLL